MAETFVIEGKGASKSDKQLAESIMAGEMQNAWQRGDGVDYRFEKPSRQRSSKAYRENYERIFGHG